MKVMIYFFILISDITSANTERVVKYLLSPHPPYMEQTNKTLFMYVK